MDTTNHKGQSCPYKPILCQEGYCSECWLSPTTRRDHIQQDMEKTIIALVREHIRLLGAIWYELASTELEAEIKGEG